jgi:hypothetical protein
MVALLFGAAIGYSRFVSKLTSDAGTLDDSDSWRSKQNDCSISARLDLTEDLIMKIEQHAGGGLPGPWVSMGKTPPVTNGLQRC